MPERESDMGALEARTRPPCCASAEKKVMRLWEERAEEAAAPPLAGRGLWRQPEGAGRGRDRPWGGGSWGLVCPAWI